MTEHIIHVVAVTFQPAAGAQQTASAYTVGADDAARLASLLAYSPRCVRVEVTDAATNQTTTLVGPVGELDQPETA